MVRVAGREVAEALRDRQPRHLRRGACARVDARAGAGRHQVRVRVASTASCTLIDEVLSPDSSRYWDRAEYEAGRLLSFDKQYVRDWLDAAAGITSRRRRRCRPSVVAKTQERYLEAIRRLSGRERDEQRETVQMSVRAPRRTLRPSPRASWAGRAPRCSRCRTRPVRSSSRACWRSGGTRIVASGGTAHTWRARACR